MEDDDPVVQEIPVYLSQALSENLYIYQYPVRPANRDWKDVKVTNASIKPKNQLVRMEIGLNTYSDKYCSSKGEQIALNTDGPQESMFIKDREKEKSKYFRNGIMDKIVYESSSPCLETQHYAVGILQDKELHCTPIKGILQLRPSYSYFDKQDKRKVDKSKAENTDDEEKEPEAQQVTVKFARAETEVAKKAREKSYESISQRIADEPWYDAFWRHANTDQADLERMKLFSGTTLDGSALTLGATEYVSALVPPPIDDTVIAPVEELSLQDQINQMLINAKLMTFNEVVAACDAEEPAVLSALGGAGCCVRGLWVPHSHQLYGRVASPSHRTLLCATRDYVLYLFTQQSYVERRKILAIVRLPPQEILDIFQSVAKFNPNCGWELMLPPDTVFEAKYPDVMQRQNLYWDARQRQFHEMIIGECIPKRQRKKSQRDSISSDTMQSPKPRNNSVCASEEDSGKRKNKGAGGKRTRHISSSGQDGT